MPANATLPGGLDALLARLEREKATGYLVAARGSVQKRMALEDGTIVFAASNDPKDLIGQALLRAGLITEKDLVEALAASRQQGGEPRLARVLAAMRKVTPEQSAQVFQQKIRESILDVFLWSHGLADFVAASLGPGDVPFPLRFPLAEIAEEGRRRRERWKAVRATFPSFAVAFTVAGRLPAGFPATAGDKRLMALVGKGLTLEKILLELHGQDYAIGVRLANLVRTGVLAPKEPEGFEPVEIEVEVELPDGTRPEDALPSRGVSEIPAGEFTKADPLPSGGTGAADGADAAAPEAFGPEVAAALLSRAKELLEAGSLEECEKVLTELIQNDPMADPEVWEVMGSLEAAVVAEAESIGLGDSAMLALAGPVTLLSGRKDFGPTETFVLSRFAAGRMTVGALKIVCPFPPNDLYRALRKLLVEGIIRPD